MTQLTVTGPYVNRTLFEQAGVDLPGDGATWDDWAVAVNEVAQALEVPISDGVGPVRPPRVRPGHFHGSNDV